MSSIVGAKIEQDADSFANLAVGTEATLRFLLRLQPNMRNARAILHLDADFNAEFSSCKDDDQVLEAAFHVQLPSDVGTCPWSLTLLLEIDGVEVCTSESGYLTLRALKVRFGSYGIPDVVIDEPNVLFNVTAKCLDGISLAGKGVEIFSRTDPSIVVARAKLSDQPETGTDSLHCAKVLVPVPSTGGLHQFGVRLAPNAISYLYEATNHVMSVRRVVGELHLVRMVITDERDGLPIEGVTIRSGPFRSSTGACGTAYLQLPEGSQEVGFWHPNYTFSEIVADIPQSTTVLVAATRIAPSPEPWEY